MFHSTSEVEPSISIISLARAGFVYYMSRNVEEPPFDSSSVSHVQIYFFSKQRVILAIDLLGFSVPTVFYYLFVSPGVETRLLSPTNDHVFTLDLHPSLTTCKCKPLTFNMRGTGQRLAVYLKNYVLSWQQIAIINLPLFPVISDTESRENYTHFQSCSIIQPIECLICMYLQNLKICQLRILVDIWSKTNLNSETKKT